MIVALPENIKRAKSTKNFSLLIGCIFIAFGVYYLYNAYKGDLVNMSTASTGIGSLILGLLSIVSHTWIKQLIQVSNDNNKIEFLFSNHKIETYPLEEVETIYSILQGTKSFLSFEVSNRKQSIICPSSDLMLEFITDCNLSVTSLDD